MISLRRSLRLWSILTVILLQANCAVKTREDIWKEEQQQSGAVQEGQENKDIEEFSLRADREELSEVRSSIPEVVKKQNDELALVLGMMQEYNRPPNQIRQRFDKVMRRKRRDFNKKMKRERDDFTRDERKTRDNFLREIKEKREDFDRRKEDRESRNRFNADYREDRDRFFNDQREKRMEMESEWRIRRRDYEAYVREKRSDFTEALRNYTKGYYEFQKGKKLQKKMEKKKSYLERRERSAQQKSNFNRQLKDDMDQFNQIYSKPVTPLATDEE